MTQLCMAGMAVTLTSVAAEDDKKVGHRVKAAPDGSCRVDLSHTTRLWFGGTKVITSGGVVTPKTGGKHQPSEPESGGDKQRIHVITCKKRYLLAFCVSGFVAFLQMRI